MLLSFLIYLFIVGPWHYSQLNLTYLAMSDKRTPSGARFENAISQSASHLSDRDIISDVAGGSTTAFEKLIDRYLPEITRFAAYLLGSIDAAEDVVQQVFISTWNNRETLNPDASIKSYLYKAVRNRCLNELDAREIRGHVVSLSAMDAGATVPGPPPEDERILIETTVQQALIHLPERRRAAVNLRIAEDLSYPEIAHILEISTDAAERLVRRALVDLRALLKEML